MGEVYKAIDTRLHRTVAIKVLLSHVAGDPQLRQRFEHEARTLGALKHPHICPIHDVGSVNGADYLVMEFLEGETLADRLKQGAFLSTRRSRSASRSRTRSTRLIAPASCTAI